MLIDGSSTVHVRPARDGDDLDALHEGCGSWIGADLIRGLFAADDGAPKQMLVAEVDGVPAGFASAVGAGIADGRRGLGHVYVLPQHRRRGVGGALWQGVLEVCTPARVPGIALHADADDDTSLDVARAHGLVPGSLHHESVLDLGAVERLRPLASAPLAAGVEIRTLPEDATEDDWHAFHEVFTRLFADAPDVAAGAEPMPYAVLRAVIVEPWQVTGAWRAGELVGLTAIVVRDRGAGRLNTWFTGVEREARGLGLATALKSAQAVALAESGWRSITTQNMEGNDAILAANRRLGFVTTAGTRDLTYDFPDATVSS